MRVRNRDRSRRLRLDAGTYHVYAVYGDGCLMEGSPRIRGNSGFHPGRITATVKELLGKR